MSRAKSPPSSRAMASPNGPRKATQPALLGLEAEVETRSYVEAFTEEENHAIGREAHRAATATDRLRNGVDYYAWTEEWRDLLERLMADRNIAGAEAERYRTDQAAATALATNDGERQLLQRMGEDAARFNEYVDIWLTEYNERLQQENIYALSKGAPRINGRDTLYRVKLGTPQKMLQELQLEPAVSNETIFEPEFDLLRALSMQPAQTVDRAARNSQGWLFPEDGAPRYTDSNNDHYVEYRVEGQEIAELQNAVQRLNPRTADVWRILTARSLEAWQDGQLEPPAVWFDLRELAELMGYTKHVNGGYRTRDLDDIARAIQDLDAFHITIPLGSKIMDLPNPKTGKRKSTRVEAIRHYKVLFKAATDELRESDGSATYPMRWQLKPGEWIKSYSKSYAPLYRAIVELPGKSGTPTWAKAIGTELSYQYRQDRDRSPLKTLTVRKLLERACLLEEAARSRNKGRMRQYFEEALDLLQSKRVCEGWQYRPEDINRVEAKYNDWFKGWLECRVDITAPQEIISKLPKLSNASHGRPHP